MNTVSLFGYEWEIKLLVAGIPEPIFEYYNKQIGKFYALNVLGTNCPEEEWYKVIALIHEKDTFKIPYFFITNEQIKRLKDNVIFSKSNNTICTLDECLADFPANIVEIQERSLMLLYKKYPKYGHQISGTEIKKHHFFSDSKNDFFFITQSLKNKNWIDAVITEDDSDDCDFICEMQIAVDGWGEIEKNINRNYSKQGFIAMWFDPQMDNVREKIKEAIKDTHIFTPQRMDEKQFNNEITGEIMFEISRSKFVVADLTGQRNGVYFEAGYAIAKNIPVIFTCKKEKDNNVHFDVNHYNIIFWDNEDELFTKLKDRILGTIVL